tara:strand:+ start:645 stop:1010 length:366 start_codon:yes stop_codon:yes gene_type:complete
MNINVETRDYFVSTSLQGRFTASYDQLVKVFGEPQCSETSGDGKVDIEWELTVEDKEFGFSPKPVTIYNWKDYDGGLEAMTNPKYEWHIGGLNFSDAVSLKEYFQRRLFEREYFENSVGVA